MESPYLSFDDQLVVGDCPIEANTPLDEGVPAMSPLDVEEVGIDAPSRVVTDVAPSLKSTGIGPRKKGMLDRVLVSMYVFATGKGSSLDGYSGSGSQGRAKNCPPLEPPQPGGISGYAHVRPLSKLLPNTHVDPLRIVYHSASCLYGQRNLLVYGR